MPTFKIQFVDWYNNWSTENEPFEFEGSVEEIEDLFDKETESFSDEEFPENSNNFYRNGRGGTVYDQDGNVLFWL